MEILSAQRYPSFTSDKSQPKTLLPTESPIYDEASENYVRFVQAANAFVAVNIILWAS